MKIIKYLVLSIFIIGLISCSSDDDGGDSYDIIGEWTITEGYIDPTSIQLDMGGIDIPVEISGTFVGLDVNNSLTFMDDNSFTSQMDNISLEMDMVVMGVPQTETIGMSDVFGEGNWEINGNTLTIHNENGTTIPYRIENLNGDNLELSGNVKDMALDSGPNPMLESMDIDIQMKLKRI